MLDCDNATAFAMDVVPEVNSIIEISFGFNITLLYLFCFSSFLEFSNKLLSIFFSKSINSFPVFTISSYFINSSVLSIHI